MTDNQLATILFAAPFLFIAGPFLIVETWSQIALARHERRAAHRPE